MLNFVQLGILCNVKKINVVTTQLLLMCTLGSIKLSFCGRLIAIGDTEGHHCSKLTIVSSSYSFTAKLSSKTIPVSDSGNPLEHYMNFLIQSFNKMFLHNTTTNSLVV